MKQAFTLIISFLLFQSLSAQHISVESFTKLETDMDARVHHPKRDQNGELSAIIKVVTTETGFAWDGGTLGIVDAVRKIGEYWVYVPRGAQRITISHDRLSVLRNYAYPIPIEAATVYEMRLTTARLETVVVEPVVHTQWLIIESDPPQADVYIDNIHKGQTPLQIEMNTGTYNYRIDKPLYHADAGRVELTVDKRVTITSKLKPNHGFIKVVTRPESGAEVLINGSRLPGTTPVLTDKLRSGVYQLTVNKTMYHTVNQDVTVNDGETTEVHTNLRPNFGVISVSTKPESGAEVLLNGVSTGKTTPCELDRIATGQHQITVRKEWYQPRTIAVDVKEGVSENFEIDMQPTFGTLKVNAEHDAEIFINNDRRAAAQWEGRLIAGWYTIEARKDKYHTDQKRVEIKLGETQNLSLHPKPKTGMLKIQTTPYDADITLNGVNYGKTPTTIRDLLIGEYIIVMRKTGYAELKMTVKVSENEVVDVSEILSSELEVSINSIPQGADIYINGNHLGKTPANVPVTIGQQVLVLKYPLDYIDLRETIVVNTQNYSFTFTLKPDPNSVKMRNEFIQRIYGSGSDGDFLIGAALFDQLYTIKLLYIDNNYALLTPPLLARGSAFNVAPQAGKTLSALTWGFSVLGDVWVAPKSFLKLDFISLCVGYLLASGSHKTRLHWEVGASLNYQFALNNPDKTHVRVALKDLNDDGKGGAKFGWIPLYTEANLEFFLGKKSFLMFTGGAMWAPERNWYLKSEVKNYKENGGLKPSPQYMSNLVSPFIEGIQPYFGIGLRF